MDVGVDGLARRPLLFSLFAAFVHCASPLIASQSLQPALEIILCGVEVVVGRQHSWHIIA